MQAAMAKRKRHSRVEIASKLAQANDLATQGKLQSEIARTLGVSVMTLHRWRKAPPGPRPALVATHEAGHPYRMRRGGDRIAELQLENSRLRRLVTDLLLEKIKLEEATQSQSSIGWVASGSPTSNSVMTITRRHRSSSSRRRLSGGGPGEC
jgi:putative transposase